MDMGGWNLNWQGFGQGPTVYQDGNGDPDAPGYPNGDPPLTDTAEDEQMGGMADSLATLRPDPEQDEFNIALENTIPGHMPYDGVQYPTTESSQRPSQPSATTSQTSLDDLFHDYDMESDQMAQQGFNAHDLVHVAGWNQTAPTIADHIDLGDATGAQATQPPALNIDHQPPPQVVHPEMMGLSDRGNESVTLPTPTLQDHLSYVNTHYQKLFAPGEAVLTLEDLVQTQQSLGHLTSNVDALIKTRESMAPKNPSISTPSSFDRGPQMFRCIQCLQEGKPASIFYNVGSFKRHVSEQHYPQFEFHCPLDRCHEIKYRRSKMKDHLTNTHKQIPRPRMIEDNTHERPVEPLCKFCSQTTRSWKDFYNCFMSHCVISSPSQSRRSSDDRGSAIGGSGPGPGPGNNAVSSLDQSHANPPPLQPAPPAYGTYGNDGFHDQSTAFQGENSSQGYHLSVSAPMSRSVSDDVLRGPASTNASPSRLSRHSHLNRRVISGDPLSGITPGHRRSPLPRSALRNSARQSAGSSETNCRGCGRQFDTCTICRSGRISGGRCCRCYSSSSAIGVSQTGPGQGQITRYINPATGIPEPQLQTHLTQQGVPAPPVYGTQQAPQPVPPRFQGNFGSQMARVMGMPSASPRGDQYDVMAVTEITEPSFDELDMEYSMCESEIAQPVRSWITSLPMRAPLARSVIKPLKSLSDSLYGGTCIASPRGYFPEPARNPISPSRCNCPCRAAAKLQEAYLGRAHAELSPGRQVKLDLKILSPERHGTGQHPSHLRTRVQLVVKLLKLRTSAARSPGKKQKKEANQALEQALQSTFERSELKVAEETDDSDESDTDSIFDDTASMSSSCSDVDALAPATPVIPYLKDECPGSEQGYEETTALSFDFDLDSTLYTLSRWSGGLSEDLCSDLTVMDPRSVLEYFFGYIMYVMVILSQSGDYGHGPRLGRGDH